jgi:hypothetical protein
MEEAAAGGMSAAARARATVSSSSGGTAARGGGSVSWWAFTVLGCMDGFLSQGPAPWVILADGPGGLICARICPGTLSRRWYANTSRHIGHEGGNRRAAGRLAVPSIAADLRTRILSRKWEPGAGLARLQDPCPLVRSQPGHAGRSTVRAASCPATRRKQRENEYIQVRSVVHNRPQSTGEQQVSAAGPQIHIDGLVGRPGAGRAPAQASRRTRRALRSCGHW